MKDIRRFDCMECQKGKVEFDISLNEKQIYDCKVCGNLHKVRPYKNGRVDVYNLDKKSISFILNAKG